MKSKIIKNILITLLISAIPSVLSYLASSDLIFDYLIEKNIVGSAIDVPFVQDCCLWTGIAISALFLSLRLIIIQIRFESIQEERNMLIKMNLFLKHFLLFTLVFNMHRYLISSTLNI